MKAEKDFFKSPKKVKSQSYNSSVIVDSGRLGQIDERITLSLGKPSTSWN